jgi:hypothetical protein
MSNPFADDDAADNPFTASPAPDPTPDFSTPPPTPPHSAPPPDPSPPPSRPAASSPLSDLSNISLKLGAGDYRDPVTGMVLSKAQMDQRESELAKREAEISKYEQQVASGTFVPRKEKNFPPYLNWWAWHPDRDLPVNIAPSMKKLRLIFLGVTLVYVINVIGCFALMSPGASEKVRSPATHIVLSLVFLIVLCPLSFELAFFGLYKAVQRGKGLKFFVSLFWYVVWFAFLCFNVVGLIDTGSVGFMIMFQVFGGSTGAGVVALIFCICGSGIAVLLAIFGIWLVRYYRTNGLSKKAMMEGATIAADYAKDHPDQAVAVVNYTAGQSVA